MFTFATTTRSLIQPENIYSIFLCTCLNIKKVYSPSIGSAKEKPTKKVPSGKIMFMLLLRCRTNVLTYLHILLLFRVHKTFLFPLFDGHKAKQTKIGIFKA